jgi:serine/threonine protein kinase
MEFCNGGDMDEYLTKKGGRLPEDEAVEYLRQILNGFRVTFKYNSGIA